MRFQWVGHRVLGWTAVAFFLIHGFDKWAQGYWYFSFWACHLACLLAGVGLLSAHPWAVSVAFCWLTLGVPTWIIGLVNGEPLSITSTLTHIGGLLIAGAGFRYVRMPKNTWIVALGSLIALIILSRYITPVPGNVNVSQRIWEGWEPYFANYWYHISFLVALAAGDFFLAESFARALQNQ